MPDAADRIRPAAKPPSRSRAAALARALAPRSKRGVAGAAMVALMAGIVVNAVALQHGKRVDPVPEPSIVAAVKPPAPAPAPAPTPEPTLQAVAPPHIEKPDDPIASLIRAQSGDKRKLTFAAQKALVKLGYVVKPSGALDADTKSALAEFAKSHKISAPGEVTAKLVKTLTAAADDE